MKRARLRTLRGPGPTDPNALAKRQARLLAFRTLVQQKIAEHKRLVAERNHDAELARQRGILGHTGNGGAVRSPPPPDAATLFAAMQGDPAALRTIEILKGVDSSPVPTAVYGNFTTQFNSPLGNTPVDGSYGVAVERREK